MLLLTVYNLLANLLEPIFFFSKKKIALEQKREEEAVKGVFLLSFFMS